MSTTLSRETLSLPLRGSVAAACAACADRLTAAVRLLPGVASAALDERAGRLSVEIDPAHVSPDAVGEQVKRITGELAEEWEHRTYRVGGMDCASCAASIETALNRLPGVSATVNFPAARLRVEHARGGNVAEIEGRVRTLGFTVEPDARGTAVRDLPAAAAPGETCCGGHEHGHEHAAPAAKPRVSPDVLRVTASGLLLAAGLVLEHALGWEKASAFVFAGSMLAGGYRFALAGLRALRLRTVGTNLLMAVAAVGAGFIGQWAEAAAVVFLYALGETLEGAAMERTRRSLRTLIEAAPAEATVMDDGGATRTVAAADLEPGDTILVRPGARVAADGVVVTGASEVAEAAITGESLPRAKTTGDSVYAGSVNGAGALTVRVTAAAEDSTLARILHLVEEAQGRKAPAQAFVERLGRVYTPAVIVAAVLLAVLGPLVAPGPDYVYRALTLLVVACPCALVIATPVAYVTAIARAARSGVLVKGGAVLEALAGARRVAFDKTGTLTTGRPAVRDIVAAPGVSADELLGVAAAAERASEHPIAAAVLAEAERRGADAVPDTTDAVALPGRGVAASVDGFPVLVGTRVLMDERGVALPAAVADAADRMAAEGATVLLVARDGAVLGALSVADTPRPEASATVAALKRLGLSPAMLTGDLAPVAAQVGAAVGVPAGDIGAQLLPEDKLRRVEGMARAGDGGAVFVGDGINDAPALAAATVGVAMGAGGTAAALEAADVALVESDLSRLPLAVRLARVTRAVVRQNVVLALGTVAVLIFGTFVGRLPLWVGVLGHEGSALLVIANALRLLSPALTRVER